MWVNNNPWDELHQEKKRDNGSDKSSCRRKNTFWGLCCLYSGSHILKPPGNQQVRGRNQLLFLLVQFIPTGILFVHYMPPQLNWNRLQVCLAMEHCACCVLFIYLFFFLMFDHILLCRQPNKHTFGITPHYNPDLHTGRRRSTFSLSTQVSQHCCLWTQMLITHTHTESALSPSSLSLLWISYALWDGTLTLK